MDKKIINKFTTHLKNSIKKAKELCVSLGHPHIEPEHLVYGLILQKGSIAAEILIKMGLTAERIRSLVVQNNKEAKAKDQTTNEVALADTTKKILEKAALIAHKNNHKYIGTEHLLYSLIQANSKAMINLWENNRVNLNKLKTHLDTMMRSTSRFPDLTQIFEQAKESEKEEKTKDASKNINEGNCLMLAYTFLSLKRTSASALMVVPAELYDPLILTIPLLLLESSSS